MRRSAVLVLEEAAVVASQVGAVRAADHFERRHLHAPRLEPRLVGHDRRRVGLEHRAGQHQRERLADADRAGAGPPPAAERVDLDVGGRGQRRRCDTSAPTAATTHEAASRARTPSSCSRRSSSRVFRSRRSATNSLSAIVALRSRRGRGAHVEVGVLRHPRHLVLPRRAPAAASARERAARHHARRGRSRRRTPRSSRPRPAAARRRTRCRSSTRNTSCVALQQRQLAAAPSSASSNRKSEITGTSDVLRMKPASVVLRLPAALDVLQAALILVGVEAVDHLALAGPRPDRRQVLEAGVERDQAERILEEHRRHADGRDRAGDRRGDRHAVDAAPRRQRAIGDRRRRVAVLGCSNSRTIERGEVGQRRLRPVDRREPVARPASRAGPTKSKPVPCEQAAMLADRHLAHPLEDEQLDLGDVGQVDERRRPSPCSASRPHGIGTRSTMSLMTASVVSPWLAACGPSQMRWPRMYGARSWMSSG